MRADPPLKGRMKNTGIKSREDFLAILPSVALCNNTACSSAGARGVQHVTDEIRTNFRHTSLRHLP
jgi:hypothetical protein